MSAQRKSFEPGHLRKFLVIVDETPECDRAVYSSARRASRGKSTTRTPASAYLRAPPAAKKLSSSGWAKIGPQDWPRERIAARVWWQFTNTCVMSQLNFRCRPNQTDTKPADTGPRRDIRLTVLSRYAGPLVGPALATAPKTSKSKRFMSVIDFSCPNPRRCTAFLTANARDEDRTH